MRGRLLLLVTLLLLAPSLRGETAATPPAASLPAAVPTLVLSGTVSRTGKFADTGRQLERGYRIFAERANARGGILGAPVRLSLEDDRSDPRRARALYERILEARGSGLVLAPYSSEITLAVADLLERSRVPVLAAGASSPRIWATPRKYLLGLYHPSDRQMEAFLEMAATRGIRSVAIVGFADPYSTSAAEGGRDMARRMGLSVVRFRILSGRKGAEIAAEASAMAASSPEAVVVCGYLSDAISLRLATKRAGITPKAFAATVGPALPDFRELMGPLAEGVFGPSEWEPLAASRGSESAEFVEAYRSRYREDPSYQAALGFAAGQLLRAAAEEARSTDPERILASLRSGEASSIVGTLRLRPDGARAGASAIVVQWQRHRKEIVWPAALRTKEPVF